MSAGTTTTEFRTLDDGEPQGFCLHRNPPHTRLVKMNDAGFSHPDNGTKGE